MAAFIMEFVDIGAGHNHSLADRLATGPLPLPYALTCAIDVASTLRDLHQKGLAHGEVGLPFIQLSESGARLQPRSGRIRLADTRSDVAAFGAALYEMITGQKPPNDIKFPVFKPVTTAMDMNDVRTDAIRLAEKCLDGSPDIKQVFIELRILGILTRRLAAVPYRAQAVETPVTVAPELGFPGVVEKPVPVEEEPPSPEFDDVVTEQERPKVEELPATLETESLRPQMAELPATLETGPPHPLMAEVPAKVDSEPLGAEVTEVPAVASEPLGLEVAELPSTLVTEPQQPPVTPLTSTSEPEMLVPDATSDQRAAAVVICPRCHGVAPFTAPASIFDKLLNRISHIRQCSHCGYRFIILRFVRQRG
jgi:hypothetical protein